MTASWAGFAADPAPVSGLSIDYRDALPLPDAVPDSAGTPVPLTGLSGIAWLGADRYVAVMDNSNRLLRMRLALSAEGAPLAATDFEIVTLPETHDYEDIAPRPGGDPGVFVCAEDSPAIRAFRLADGAAVGTVPLPEVFRGRRINRGLEALALDPDHRHLWTANEEALSDDGAAAQPECGTIVRLARLPLVPGSMPFQAAYRVDPPHAFIRMLPAAALSGVVALVALGQGRLLVLERSGGPGLPPFENRIYLVDTRGATDVSAVGRGLGDLREPALAKTPLWADSLGLNVEGLCLGPRLGTNHRALVAVADNGGLGTPNHVAGFELSAVTSP